MTKEDFLHELEKKLSRLPSEEREAVMEYYYEYFEEAGPEREQEVLEELKSPSHIASKVLAEFAHKEMSEGDTVKREATKKNKNVVLFLILALLASHIALPLLIVILVLVVVIFAVLISFAIAFVVIFAALFFAGIFALFTFPSISLLLIGISLVSLGCAIGLFILIKNFISFMLRKLAKK